MKKVMLMIAGCLFMFSTATFAQQDSTDMNSNGQYDQGTQGNEYNQDQNNQDQTQGMYNDQNDDRVQIQSSDLPDAVQQSLDDNQYKGWENGTFYKSQTGDKYFVEVPSTTGGTSTTYEFNSDGNLVRRY